MINLSDLVPVITWVCPKCVFRDITKEAELHTRFHSCSGMSGLTMPMVREGEHVKVTAYAREDYVGTEDVPMVAGVPVMNVTTEYDDGHTDVAVFAPTAYSRGN